MLPHQSPLPEDLHRERNWKKLHPKERFKSKQDLESNQAPLKGCVGEGWELWHAHSSKWWRASGDVAKSAILATDRNNFGRGRFWRRRRRPRRRRRWRRWRQTIWTPNRVRTWVREGHYFFNLLGESGQIFLQYSHAILGWCLVLPT